MKRLVAIALFLCTGAAAAEPSIWARARRPDEEARRALVAEAETLQLKYHRLVSERRQHALDRREVETLAGMYLQRAAELLEQAGAAASPDHFVRLELADVYGLLGKHKEATAVLEGLLRSSPEPPIVLRTRAWASLAVTYAHVGRVEDEIHAYGKALEQQPVSRERARILANRAEAYMLLGDISAAVEGYRAALALLSSDYLLFGSGPTTLWGLAVALDRSGDLDGGLDAVRLARAYDPLDRQINGPGWFYVPDYDRHWYAALGHWAVARKADVASVRAEAYGRAVAALEEFVGRAARDDKWLPLARVRLKQCEKERAAFLKQSAARRPAEARAPKPR